MDGVPAPISMLVDPSVNPEAIALVSLPLLFHYSSLLGSSCNIYGYTHQATETMMYDMLMGEEDASPNWDPEMNWYVQFSTRL